MQGFHRLPECLRMGCVGLIAMLTCASTWGQETSPGPRKLIDEPVAPNAPAVQPSPAPTVRNPALDPANVAGRRVLPEGSMVNAMTGVLLRTAGNDVIFLPDAPESVKSKVAPTQPFVLVPCQKLAQLESATKSAEPGVRVTLSGQVYVYRARQYLLTTTYSIKQSDQSESVAPQAPSKASESVIDSKREPPRLDPRVEDLIRELENERGGERVLDPAPDTDQPAVLSQESPEADKDGSAERLIAEGTLFNSRRGRLVRIKSAAGRLGFAFDNDPDSPSTLPMLVVPCAMLTNMEAAARNHGDELSFTLSGRVLVYEGRNYLLPVLYQVRRPSDIKSLQ